MKFHSTLSNKCFGVNFIKKIEFKFWNLEENTKNFDDRYDWVCKIQNSSPTNFVQISTSNYFFDQHFVKKILKTSELDNG